MRGLVLVGMLVGAVVVAQLRPQIVDANQATPAPAEDPGSLGEMLSLLPPLAIGGDSGAMVSYSNVAGQLAAVGMPTSPPDDEAGEATWYRAIQPVLYYQSMRRLDLPDWREVFGFNLEQINQIADYAAPPLGVTLFRGRFDENELRTALERSGYQTIEIDGTTVYSLADDFDIVLDSDAGRLALAYMNFVALLADGTLVATSARDAMEGVLAAARGDEPSFADGVAIAPLIRAAPPDLGAALFIGGSMLIGSPDPTTLFLDDGTPGAIDVDAIATQIAEEIAEAQRLPPVVAAMIGSTVGGPVPARFDEDEAATPPPLPPDTPQSRAVMALTFTSPAMAETASDVIADRFETLPIPDSRIVPEGVETYGELFVERSVTAIADEPVVLLDLVPGPETRRTILVDFLFSRTLTLVAWSP